jgi:hypothetical protein
VEKENKVSRMDSFEDIHREPTGTQLF